MAKLIYLDHGATTPVHPDVLRAMMPYFSEFYANASSVHSPGKIAREAIEKSREQIARCLGSNPQEIIFTGSGTEADNLAILGTAAKLRKFGKHVITSVIEHPAVRNPFKKLEVEGFDVTYIPADSDGLISVDDVSKSIREDTILISIMYVNNEIGTIQPIEAIGELAAKKQIIFHTDAVQAVGKLRINLQSLKVDLLSASAHKFYGPKGVGFLFYRNAGAHPKFNRYIQPITFGGGHEFSMRPATENVAGIVGCAKALELAVNNLPEESERLRKIRDEFIEWVLKNIPESQLNGHLTKRLYNNANFRFNGVEGDQLVQRLDTYGIAVSAGSACSSKSHDGSYVVRAINSNSEAAYGTLRITMGASTTPENIAIVKECLKKEIMWLRSHPQEPNTRNCQ